jgi:TRAP-type mannitol/chloroaromatic compound transport system permease large subunit
MGGIAFNPMLKAGYDVKLVSGVITAGGTLGILIPPSVMIIVYAAIAGQSVVKFYGAAMFPGFFLALLYLVYIVGWALLNPRIAPKLLESKTRLPVRPWVKQLQQTYSHMMLPALVAAAVAPAQALNITIDGARLSYGTLFKNLGLALVPLVLTLVAVWGCRDSSAAGRAVSCHCGAHTDHRRPGAGDGPPVAMSAFYLKGVAAARFAQPDLLRHDALHADRHRLHGDYVFMARHDAVAAELSLQQLTGLTSAMGKVR